MEIGAWPKFPSTEIFLQFEIPTTPISPIPDIEKINDDSMQETAKVPLYFMWDHPFKMSAFLRGRGKDSKVGQICRREGGRGQKL